MPSSLNPPLSSRAIVLSEVVELGGAERSCLALSRWLHEHDLPNHLVTFRDEVGLERFTSHPLEIVTLRTEMTPSAKVRALRQYFARRPGGPHPLVSGYQPAQQATLAGLRGFHCLMHDTPSLFGGIHVPQSLRRRLSRHVSNRIIAHGLRSGGQTMVTSTYLRNETREVFGVDPVIVRMGGLSAPAPFRVRTVTDRLRMLSVSRVEPNKRVDWMVRALAALERQTPSLSSTLNWQLDIAGRGSHLNEVRELTRQLSLDDRIRLHGFVTDAELQERYNSADLFLMPAVQGYGIPAIEALQRGIPVLVHRQSGVSDILRNTPWVIVFDGDESAMLPALTEAIRSVREGRQLNAPLPILPTEDSWAEKIAQLCRWT